MSTRNRMGNLNNQYQTNARRVLCLCSAGMLRSPTVAWVLSNPPYNFNTRAAGLIKEYALIPVDEAMIFWADDVIVMDSDMKFHVDAIIDNSAWKDDFERPNIFVWGIPDLYNYRDPELVRIITELANRTYSDPKFIYTDNIGGIECNHCGYISPDYEEKCQKCGRRLTEI